jgi:hypothetical protein
LPLDFFAVAGMVDDAATNEAVKACKEEKTVYGASILFSSRFQPRLEDSLIKMKVTQPHYFESEFKQGPIIGSVIFFGFEHNLRNENYP